MEGERAGTPRTPTRAGLRQALVALLVSAAAVGGIAAVSDDNGERAVSPAATPTTVVQPTTPQTTTLQPAITVDTAPLVTSPPLTSPPLTSPPLTSPDVTAQDVTAPATATSAPTSTPATSAVAVADAIPAVADAPAVSAGAYAVYDATAGSWMAGSQADTPVAVGSVMKLLTSYVVLQAGSPDKIVTVPQLTVDINESSIGLYAGEQLRRDVLFRAMIIVSANDAARALATDVGGSIDGFVHMMNAAAADLGLTNTVAANPIGLDAAGAHSSARDVVMLGALMMRNADFAAAVAKTTASLHQMVFTNTNKLLTTYPGADGIKTGHTTEAGYCVVASAVRNGRRIIVAVLGSPTDSQRFTDAAALLDWAFAH